ncbi:KHG/KDPG aldolase [Baekduia alba]|uniref:bifunctional 4-hydroxy-2-oxoglutarate aldolase/2-dehydro-3-deoxy-phosphogluconate aldolase n=1 Tax=Baekduia alba TaxID=2997333 RepID=UPI002340E4C7|nr:bifunctional 4-hydroxy-2-oxoglutarate aldolase/2-dehydro-3-deoxy-phosphogluconate aldolase [Baekduia alba]WCB93454.1 KHG/KDPG aldolase [Baekduia alba]
MTDVVDLLAAQRVVPVIRSADVADAVATARACARAGMRLIELTRSVPDVDDALRELRDDGLVLGVGTVTEPAHVQSAARAGARFVVSFTRPPGVVAQAAALGLAAIPGGFTPTELAACAATGARVVKLFPARLAAPAYLRDVRAVLPGVDVLVTGGLGGPAGDVAAWLDAGAIAVGVGGELGTAATLGPQEVERRARAVLDLAHATIRQEGVGR